MRAQDVALGVGLLLAVAAAAAAHVQEAVRVRRTAPLGVPQQRGGPLDFADS